jgi:hypothetical protein
MDHAQRWRRCNVYSTPLQRKKERLEGGGLFFERLLTPTNVTGEEKEEL